MLAKKNRRYLDSVANGKIKPSLKEAISITTTFAFTTFAWIFFRAESITLAWDYITEIFSVSIFTIPQVRPKILLGLLIFFLYIEWRGRGELYAIEKTGLSWKKPYRLAFYYILVFVIFLFSGEDQEFIYFQF